VLSDARYSQTRKVGGEMGSSRRSGGKKGLFVQFPDGSVIDSQADMDRLMSKFTFTPKTIKKWRLFEPDIHAISLASARMASIGFDDETIIAFGPVHLMGFPKDHNSYTADAILTPGFLIIYYQKRLAPDFLILSLRNLSGLTSTGPWSAQFSFKNGIIQERQGTFEMAETFFELSEKLGKDGQANRRSITFMRSLANTLSEVHQN